MADQIIRCDSCEFSFDAMDGRGSVHLSTMSSEGFALCPYCLLTLRSTEEWAIWNSCNGIFELRPRRAEALKVAALDYARCDVSVVPARAFVEPEDEHHLRGWRESELERRRAWHHRFSTNDEQPSKTTTRPPCEAPNERTAGVPSLGKARSPRRADRQPYACQSPHGV